MGTALKRTHDQFGFTLLELIIGTSISFVLIGAGLAASMNLAQWWTTGNASQAAYTMKLNMLQSLQSSKAWWNTISDSANDKAGNNFNADGNMACLKNHQDCSSLMGKSIRFRLIDTNGGVVFDPFTTGSGFGNHAAPCTTYDSQNGNGACPFTYDLRWTPICPQTGSCIDPVVSVTANFSYKFPQGVTTVLNPVNYDIHQAVSAPQIAAPIPPTDVYFTMKNQGFTANIQAAAQANYSGGTITINQISSPSNGTAILNSDGTVTYTPNTNYMGVDSYSYQMKTNQGATSFGTVWVEVVTPYTWMGTAGDSNWQNGRNWCGSINATNTACVGAATAPPTTQTAIFTNVCSSQCNATVSTNINAGGIDMEPSYPGTISQSSGVINLGTAGFTQYAGAFQGGKLGINVSGSVSLNGGQFTSTSGQLVVGQNWNVSNNMNFNANSGAILFNANSVPSPSINPGNAKYNDVAFAPLATDYNLGSYAMNVYGKLSIECNPPWCGSINSGTLNAYGDITTSGTGYPYFTTPPGSVMVDVKGNPNGQMISGVPTAGIPNLTIDAGTNPVTLKSTVVIYGNYTMNNAGTFTTTGATLDFQPWQTSTITPGNISYDNVTFNQSGKVALINGTLTVGKTLTLADGYVYDWYNPDLQGGTIVANGNVVLQNYGGPGTTLLKIEGASTVDATAAKMGWLPLTQIDAGGNIVAFSGNVYYYGDYTYISGTIDPGASTFSFRGIQNSTITPGTTTYNNVYFNSGFRTSNHTYNINGTLTVGGTLTLGDDYGYDNYANGTLLGGKIIAQGNVDIISYGCPGTTQLVITGPSVIDGSTASIPYLPVTVINAGSNTVNFVGTLEFPRGYTYTSGNINAGTSQVVFWSNGSQYSVTPGNTNFNDVSFVGTGVGGNTISGTLNVGGNLTLDCEGWFPTVNSGAIKVQGSVSTTGSCAWNGGSSQIVFSGNTGQTLSQASGSKLPGSSLTVNGTGTTVTLSSPVTLNNGNQGLNVVSGSVNLAGNNLSCQSLTLNGNTLTKNGGTLTVAGTQVKTGNLYGGTINP